MYLHLLATVSVDTHRNSYKIHTKYNTHGYKLLIHNTTRHLLKKPHCSITECIGFVFYVQMNTTPIFYSSITVFGEMFHSANQAVPNCVCLLLLLEDSVQWVFILKTFAFTLKTAAKNKVDMCLVCGPQFQINKLKYTKKMCCRWKVILSHLSFMLLSETLVKLHLLSPREKKHLIKLYAIK